MNWKYKNPVEVFFGEGTISLLSSLVAGSRAALITTEGFSKRGTVDLLRQSLGTSLSCVYDHVTPNPSFESVKKACSTLQGNDYDVILALGGGSSIDTAKAVAAVDAARDETWLESHLKGHAPFPDPSALKKIIALPTTAGSGSEVTMWATIWDRKNKKKYSLTHPSLYPKAAILDPELTRTLSEKTTLYSALDAFTHALEALWNKNRNPLSDTLARRAAGEIYTQLPLLKKDLQNMEVRSSIMQASLFAGLSFSNTRTALSHSLSYPLTARFGIPHGLACSLSLPYVAQFNCAADASLQNKLASVLKAGPSPESIATAMNEFIEKLGVAVHLREYGISPEDGERICIEAIESGRSGNNIADINKEELLSIVQSMM